MAGDTARHSAVVVGLIITRSIKLVIHRAPPSAIVRPVLDGGCVPPLLASRVRQFEFGPQTTHLEAHRHADLESGAGCVTRRRHEWPLIHLAPHWPSPQLASLLLLGPFPSRFRSLGHSSTPLSRRRSCEVASWTKRQTHHNAPPTGESFALLLSN